MKQQEDDQDFRIAKAVEKREMKLAQEEMDKMKNLREMQISIEKYRREAVSLKLFYITIEFLSNYICNCRLR